jgi:8-oxo-dGTP pyrophosphatase MutT (NUDIX family)
VNSERIYWNTSPLFHSIKQQSKAYEMTSLRPSVSLFCFSIVVVRHPDTGKFLVVDERVVNGRWLGMCTPGGGVEAGEDPLVAAVREVKEEAGIDVALKGLLRIDFIRGGSKPYETVKLRLVFYAEPLDPAQAPKSVPDDESRGAVWASYEEIQDMKQRSILRSDEILHWIQYLNGNGVVYPLSILSVSNFR